MAKKDNDHQIPSKTVHWVQSSLGSGAAIIDSEPLPGATSSTLHRLQIRQYNLNYAVVLRRFTNTDWLAQEPDLALHEAKSLEVASRAGIPVPELIAFDQQGVECDFPAVLMSHLLGRVVLEPQDMHTWLSGLAELLVPVHQVDAGEFPWRYYTYNDVNRLKPPAWSQHQNLWARAIEVLHTDPPQTDNTFIHRDYHPTNVLWEGERPSGVVEWVNACLGPPGIDFGHCRINLVHLYGVEVADRFLDDFLSVSTSAYTHQLYWDLLTLIKFLPGPPQMYKGWTDHRFPQVPEEELISRCDDYLVSLIQKL